MKVILAAKSVFPFHPFGGVQKYVYYFAKALVKKGMTVEIVCPLDQKNQVRTQFYEGIRYTFLKPAIYSYLEYPIGWLGVHLFSSNLAAYLKGASFDLLHSFDMVGYRYLQIKNRKPVATQIFTDNYLSNPISLWNPSSILSFLGKKTDRIKKKKVCLTPKSSRATIFKYPLQYYFKVKPMNDLLMQSQAVFFEEEIFKDEVSKLFDQKHASNHVLPVGVNVTLAMKLSLKKTKSRQELGFKEDDFILITVNRLAADKGVDKIVLAMKGIIQEIPTAKLIIVGKGYQEAEIYQILEKEGVIDSVLHLKDVAEEELFQYYRLSDVFVCAFSYPGSSISTLEAMACGLPVITTAQPWLVDEWKNGLVLGSNDPYDIKTAVTSLYKKGHLKELGIFSQAIVKKYDWDTIAGKAIGLYEKILEKK